MEASCVSSDAHPFTLEHYLRILEAARTAGYRFASFHEPRTRGEKRIYLRHDIDNDVAMAWRMATAEANLGVRATYLAMLRSANYNAAEKRNVVWLREMAAMGHEIGLHFSLIDHPDDSAALEPLIQGDARLLGELLGQPVRVFGFHNPAEPNQYRAEVPGLANTYAAPFFDDALYLSESNMRWKAGCPCGALAASGRDTVQLLVHPLSYAANLTSDRDVLLHFLDLRLCDLLAYNISQNRVLRESGLSREEVLAALRATGSGR